VLEHLRSGEAVRAFVRSVAGGPPEDALVWCARTAEAAAVVTHDPTLLHLGQIGDVQMVTPGAFVHRFLKVQ
jgi:predicted nucleic acid-binding protein